MSEIEKLQVKHKFVVQIIIGKLEFDGNSVESFNLMDRMEIVSFKLLEKKLSRFYNNGLEKIKEIKDELLIK